MQLAMMGKRAASRLVMVSGMSEAFWEETTTRSASLHKAANTHRTAIPLTLAAPGAHLLRAAFGRLHPPKNKELTNNQTSEVSRAVPPIAQTQASLSTQSSREHHI